MVGMDSSVFVPVQTQPPPTVDNTSAYSLNPLNLFGKSEEQKNLENAEIAQKTKELTKLVSRKNNPCNNCTVS